MKNVANYYLITHPETQTLYLYRCYGSSQDASVGIGEYFRSLKVSLEFEMLAQALDPDLLLSNPPEGKVYWDNLLSKAGFRGYPIINVTHRI